MRDSWHEPDEQGVSATVEGDHIVESVGEHAGSCGEMVVILKDGEGETLRVNLATVLAAACESNGVG